MRPRRAVAPAMLGLALASSAGAATFDLDDNTHARISGGVQVDGVIVDQASVDELDPATGQSLNDVRVIIRRARVRADLHSTALSFLTVGVVSEIDGNTVLGPQLRVQKAEVFAALPGESPTVRVGLGLMKVPFGAEVPGEATSRLFPEETRLSRALFPGDHDAGLVIAVRHSVFDLTLAAMNGNPINDVSFPVLDPSQHRDVVGRGGLDAVLWPGVTVRAGVSALAGVGLHPGTSPTKDTLIWRDQNEDGIAQASELGNIPAAAATPSLPFARQAIGGDARVVVDVPLTGPLTIDGAVTIAENLDRGLLVADPIAVGRDLRELGWALGATWQPWPYVVVGVRYDEYQPDLDATDARAGRLIATDATIATWSVAAALQIPDTARLTLAYDHEDNAFGRDAQGQATTLAADVLLARLQFTF